MVSFFRSAFFRCGRRVTFRLCLGSCAVFAAGRFAARCDGACCCLYSPCRVAIGLWRVQISLAAVWWVCRLDTFRRRFLLMTGSVPCTSGQRSRGRCIAVGHPCRGASGRMIELVLPFVGQLSFWFNGASFPLVAFCPYRVVGARSGWGFRRMAYAACSVGCSSRLGLPLARYPLTSWYYRPRAGLDLMRCIWHLASEVLHRVPGPNLPPVPPRPRQGQGQLAAGFLPPPPLVRFPANRLWLLSPIICLATFGRPCRRGVVDGGYLFC